MISNSPAGYVPDFIATGCFYECESLDLNNKSTLDNYVYFAVHKLPYFVHLRENEEEELAQHLDVLRRELGAASYILVEYAC